MPDHMAEDDMRTDEMRNDRKAHRARSTAAKGITSLLKAGRKGRFRVDSNLYVEIDESGHRNWGFRYSMDGKPRWMRLGAVDVTGKAGAG